MGHMVRVGSDTGSASSSARSETVRRSAAHRSHESLRILEQAVTALLLVAAFEHESNVSHSANLAELTDTRAGNE